MQLIYLDTAIDDLDVIETYLDVAVGEFTAEAVVERLRVRCRRIAELSGLLGTDRGDFRVGLRSTPHESYVIFFRYTANAVEIVNILHASRDVAAHYDEEP